MTTGLFYHDRFLDHLTGKNHPEHPDRLRAILRGLEDDGLLGRLQRPEFAPVDIELVNRLHDPGYVQHCFDDCRNHAPFIDSPDSAVCPDSADIAQLAVGAVIRATDLVLAGDLQNAFCAVRPPGHHAEFDESMGFCLFGNIAIAADYLTHRHNLERVAIVDFDVHHGNGTQHLLQQRSDILFISIHQDPMTLFPGTGFGNEIGKGEGKGFTLNIPLFPGCGDDHFKQAFDTQIMPKLDEFMPQFLLVSAGFDAAIEDPLAQLHVTTEGFAWMSNQLADAADRHCDGKLVSVLEGGYDLDALSRGVNAHVTALLDRT